MTLKKKISFGLTIAVSMLGTQILDSDLLSGQEIRKGCFPRLRANQCEQPVGQEYCPPSSFPEVCPPSSQGIHPGTLRNIPPMTLPGSIVPPTVTPGMITPGTAPGTTTPATPGATQGEMLPNQLLNPNQFLPGGTDTSSSATTPDSVLNQSAAPIAAAQQSGGGDTFAARSNTAGESSESGMRNMMIGDFFGGAASLQGPSYGKGAVTSPVMAGDRRYKMTDQLSPLPTNRIYFNYHNFSNAVTDINNNQLDVSRYSFGFEKTYLNKNASIEVRLPFASGLDSQQDITSLTNDGTQFGNMSLTSKYLLRRTPISSLSAGVATILPTASDSEIFLGGATPSVTIENDAIHTVPYLAMNVMPSNNSWVTFASQIDFAMNGNDVVSTDVSGARTVEKYNDQHLMSLDLSMGQWFWNQPNNRVVRGIAGIFELHYTTTLNDTDVVRAGPTFDAASRGDSTLSDTISNPFNRLDVLNATAGLRFRLGGKTFATFAYVAPLSEGEERLFDSEFNFNITRGF